MKYQSLSSYSEELDFILQTIVEHKTLELKKLKSETNTMLEYYGISDVALSEILKDLVKNGLIVQKKNTLYITEKGKLHTGYLLKELIEKNEAKIEKRNKRLPLFLAVITVISSSITIFLSTITYKLNNNKKVLADSISKILFIQQKTADSFSNIITTKNKLVDSLSELLVSQKETKTGKNTDKMR